jgi:starvation-inducible DNA-binding protein
MKTIEKLNGYLANLAVLNPKLHNLHWNVTGLQFMAVHKYTEELYDDVFEKYDEIAEQIKILGGTPAVTLDEYKRMATISEVPADDFSAKQVLETVKADLQTLKSQVEDIRSAADEDDDYATVAICEDHGAAYAKQLWFLRQFLAG